MIAIWLMMILVVLGLGGLAAVVFGIVYAVANKRPGVAVASVLLSLVALAVAMFVVMLLSYSRSEAVHHRVAPRAMIDKAHLKATEAHRQAQATARRAQDLQSQVAAAEGKNITEMWEHWNRPRIDLEAGAPNPSTKATGGSQSVVMKTGVTVGTRAGSLADDTNTSPNPEAVAESLSQSVDRLERLVRQVTSMTHDVSDVGTLVGRALVALQQRSAEPHSAEPAPAEIVTAAVEIESPLEASPPVLSEPRPTWVDDPPKRVGNVWREVVVAGDYETIDECYKAADIYLLLATHEHLMQLTGTPLHSTERWRPALTFHRDSVTADGQVILIANGRPADDRLHKLASMGIGLDYIRRAVAQEEYFETVERSFGPMKRLYTRVEFSPSVDAELRQKWNAYRRQERFAAVGAGTGSVLGLIALAYSLLKVDTWTKGYYTKRLFLGVPAAIIAVAMLLWADPLHIF